MMGRRVARGAALTAAFLAAVLVVSSVAGCRGPFSLVELVDGPDGKPLNVDPGHGRIGTNEIVEFSVEGGLPPYEFSVAFGVGSFAENRYTAPATPGEERITISDRAGTVVEVVFTIVGDASTNGASDNTGGSSDGASGGATTLSITPQTATVYTGQSVSFSATGGGPFSYQISDDQSGATITADGVYTAGSSAGTDTITVTDDLDGATTSAAVTVNAKAFSISPQAISVYIGQSVSFAAVGGDGPFSFQIVDNQSGASVTPSGTYTAGSVVGADTVRLTDAYDDRTVDAVVTVTAADVVTNVDYQPATITAIAGGARTGEAFTATTAIANLGGADGAENVAWTVYASADASVGGSDSIVDTGVVAGGVAAGGSQPVSISGSWPTAAGSYYLLIQVSAADDLTTGNNGNASAAATPVSDPLSITPQTATVYTGQSVSFSATGGGPFSYQISDDQSGATITAEGVYTAGSSAGTDTITVTDDLDGSTAGAIITVETLPPATSVDYEVTSVSATPAGSTTGDSVSGSVTIANVGTGGGAHAVTWTVYASPDPAGGSGYLVESGSVPSLAAGDAATVDYSGAFPASPGTYYIVASISASDDASVANNQASNATAFALSDPPPPMVEYTVANITASDTTPPAGGLLSESFTIQNTGPDAGSASITWSVYLSADSALSTGTDILVATGTTGALAGDDGAAGGSDEVTIPFTGTWPESTGSYYLIVRETADDEGTPGETVASAAFSVQETVVDVDYYVSTPPPGGTKTADSTISESFTLRNNGTSDGSATIYWSAYLSDDMTYGVGDTFVANGNRSGIPAKADSGSITFTGNWPAVSGQYYLIIRHSAADDIDATNDSSTSKKYFVSSGAIVDYLVSDITTDRPTVNAGSPIEEGFTITNVGQTSGTGAFDWNLYVSTDDVLDAADTLVDSATGLAGLSSGASHTVSSVGGAWPGTTGSYYLLVEVVAPDEGNAGNDVGASGPYAVKLPPDYTVGSYSIPLAESQAGTILSATGTFQFTIKNDGQDGSSPVSWQVYASLNSGVDGSDILLKSGIEPALAAGESGAPITFSDALWPSFGSRYYLILSLSADDDESPHNNILAEGPIMVPQVYVEGTENNDQNGKTQVPLTNVSDLDATVDAAGGTGLSPYQLIRVDATGDESSRYDTMAFNVGTGVASVRSYATWSATEDLLELYMWDEKDWETSARIQVNGREPDTGYLVGTVWSAGERAYVSPKFKITSTYPYALYIEALP